jgi:hypothetical protein
MRGGLNGSPLFWRIDMTDEVKTKEYTVTEGNFVTDNDGAKAGGETVKLTDEKAAPLKKAGVIK